MNSARCHQAVSLHDFGESKVLNKRFPKHFIELGIVLICINGFYYFRKGIVDDSNCRPLNSHHYLLWVKGQSSFRHMSLFYAERNPFCCGRAENCKFPFEAQLFRTPLSGFYTLLSCCKCRKTVE